MGLRVHHQKEPFDVFIGRPSKWSNPFPIRKDRSREKAVQMYEVWLRKNPKLLEDIMELDGKILGCWCNKDQLCHGDIILKIIDERKLDHF